MRRHLLLGAALVLVGLALLARNLGWLPAFTLPPVGRGWPLILVAAGAYLLFFSAAADRATRLVPGIILGVYGAFLFLFTSGRLSFHDMNRYWGVFPGTVGVALAARYLAEGRREHGVLIPAAVLLAVGAIPFVREPWAFLHTYWPVGLVLIGVLVLLNRGK